MHLDRKIYDHQQGPREPIRAYVTTMLRLIRRQDGLTEEKTIETLIRFPGVLPRDCSCNEPGNGSRAGWSQFLTRP